MCKVLRTVPESAPPQAPQGLAQMLSQLDGPAGPQDFVHTLPTSGFPCALGSVGLLCY